MKILVLAGGLSPEREVSLSSGALIATALSERGHSVAFCDAYCGIFSDDIAGQFKTNQKYTYDIAVHEPNLSSIKSEFKMLNGEALIGRGIIDACMYADVVFIALHGAMGENGQLQATLDCYGIPYTGSGYVGSVLAMDKDISKQLLRQNNIPTADWLYFDTTDDFDENSAKAAIESHIGYPCVVKPTACGSSCGVSIVHTATELNSALELAYRYESSFICEKMICGREFSVGILDGQALPLIEIIPKSGWYDYKNKYQSGMTTEVTPAHLDEVTSKRGQSLALVVHKTLRLGGYSRIDFILDRDTGDFVCLEANNLPGMTPVSLLPQEAAAVGISYSDLCEKIALLALKK